MNVSSCGFQFIGGNIRGDFRSEISTHFSFSRSDSLASVRGIEVFEPRDEVDFHDRMVAAAARAWGIWGKASVVTGHM